MKKRILVTVLAFSLLGPGLGLSQAIPDLVIEHGYADLILVNGRIVTMDERRYIPDVPGHIYEAMAIKGKTIMALGTTQEMRQLAKPGAQTIDLGQRTVIPGLIATHYHLFGVAARKYGPEMGLVDSSVKLTVVAERSAEATAKKIRDTIVNAIQVQRIPEGEWISVMLEENPNNPRRTTGTWLYLGNINRRQIDGGTEKNPTIVKFGIYGMFNTAAVEAFKQVFPDWEESVDWENRAGAARDGYAPVPEQQGITFEFWWKDEPLEKLAEALRRHGEDVIDYGITTVSTRMLFPTVAAAYQMLNREGKMPHRLTYYVESQRGNYFGRKSMEEFYRASGAAWTNHTNGGEMLWVGGMANEIWDSLGREACLGPDLPASEEVKARERCPVPGTKPYDSYKAAVVNGWRPVQAHSVGSHGARLFIQMLEEASQERGFSVDYIRNLRPTIEHNTVLGNVPDVMAGIKKYGIIINCWPIDLGSAAVTTLEDYGEAARPFAMPVKTWLNQGIRVTFEAGGRGGGTDFWMPISILVTRRPPVGIDAPDELLDPVLPEEAIDRVTALKMATTWASEYVLAEDTLGTLEPGKYADFAVLDKDFFTIPVEEIRELKVLMTGLNGQIVYDAENIAGSN